MKQHLDVLVVEDILDEFEIYSRLLSSIPDHSYNCTQADNGSRAVDLLEQRHFDCILLDFFLPDMDGLTC
jgi:CheY-like chemotaxis protein